MARPEDSFKMDRNEMENYSKKKMVLSKMFAKKDCRIIKRQLFQTIDDVVGTGGIQDNVFEQGKVSVGRD